MTMPMRNNIMALFPEPVALISLTNRQTGEIESLSCAPNKHDVTGLVLDFVVRHRLSMIDVEAAVQWPK